MGEWVLKNLGIGGFKGSVYPVNPGYDKLLGYPCFASLAEIPETPDLVVFAVSDVRLEAALDEAIAVGISAAVIQSPLVLDSDSQPMLRERVREKIANAGMLVCGANGMGFYNVRDHVWTCGFDSTAHEAPGNVSLISHSGSGMSGIIDCDERLRINFAVSAGNELGVPGPTTPSFPACFCSYSKSTWRPARAPINTRWRRGPSVCGRRSPCAGSAWTHHPIAPTHCHGEKTTSNHSSLA